MKILIAIFLFFILAILTSKLKINVKCLRKHEKSFKVDFNVNVGLFLLGFIKIASISFQNDGIHFLSLKIPYKKMKFEVNQLKTLKGISIRKILKSIHLKLEKLHLDLEIGTEDVMLTAFLVFAISSILSVLSGKNRKQINLKKYYYKITPIYHTNTLEIELSTKISCSIFNILKTLFNYKKFIKNEKKYQIQIKKVPMKI